MISWYTHCLWIFKVSGLICFFLLNLCLYPSRSYSWNPKKKNSRLEPQNMCSSRSTHTSLPRFFQGAWGNGGGLLPRFFLSNVRIIGDPVAKTVKTYIRCRYSLGASDIEGLGLLGSGGWILGMGCLQLDLSGLERGYDQFSGSRCSHWPGLVFSLHGLDSWCLWCLDE